MSFIFATVYTVFRIDVMYYCKNLCYKAIALELFFHGK